MVRLSFLHGANDYLSKNHSCHFEEPFIPYRGTIHTISRNNRYFVAIFAYSQTIVCLQANECLATGKRSNGASIAPQGLLLCSQRPTSLSLNQPFPFTFPRISLVCNTARKRYDLKLKGTKKCNLRFAVFDANTSSFYVNITIQDVTRSVNNSMSAPALLACKASARPQVALQSKELWLFQCVFNGKSKFPSPFKIRDQ